jgi:hypothetical protein
MLRFVCAGKVSWSEFVAFVVKSSKTKTEAKDLSVLDHDSIWLQYYGNPANGMRVTR